MSSDEWDKMRKAKEEEFFQRQSQDAMKRLSSRQKEKIRKCPVDGQAMKQITLTGVNIDRCDSCGGIWLDGGELDAIIDASRRSEHEGTGWLGKLFGSLSSKP